MTDEPAPEAETITIEGSDGTEEIAIPTTVIELFRDGDESAGAVVGDVAVFAFAQRIHSLLYHDDLDLDVDLSKIEDEMEYYFEDRFGQSFGAMTGHDH